MSSRSSSIFLLFFCHSCQSTMIGDIISPSTGTSLCPTGSTPRNRDPKASAPSSMGVPSSLNATKVPVSSPSTLIRASPMSMFLTPPWANRNRCCAAGLTPKSISKEAGTETMDAPVSTRASNSTQFSPCGSPMAIGTLNVPMSSLSASVATHPCGPCARGSRRSLLQRAWGRACPSALQTRCRASSASPRPRRQS